MARVLQIDGGYYLATGAGYYADSPPSLALSVLSTNFAEGATIHFRVTASKTWDEDITVAYATSNGTGTAGVDYVAASGSVVIPAGSTTVDLSVLTIDRTGVQSNRTFTLTLSSPTTPSGDAPALTTAAQTVTIEDTDVAIPVPSLVVSVVGSAEEGSPLTFRVSTQDNAPTPTALTFQYEVTDGTAVNGVDYTATSGSGFIATGASSQEFQVQTIARDGYQGVRTVTFSISGANTTVATASVSGVITDTEVGAYPYFDARVAQAEHWFSRSLRSQSELLGLSPNGVDDLVGKLGVPNGVWAYVYGNDGYHTPQDGTRLIMNHSLDTQRQIHFDLPEKISTGTYTFGVEYWFGREFALNPTLADGGLVHKFIQNRANGKSGASIWVEPRCEYTVQTAVYPYTIQRDLRTYSMGANGPTNDVGEWGLLNNTPYRPTGAGAQASESWYDRVEEWCRDIFEFRLDQPGTAFTDWTAAHSTSSYPLGTRDILTATAITRNTVQRIDLTSIQGGDGTRSTRLTFNGQTTDPVSYTANVGGDISAEIKAKLDALSNIDSVAVTRVGTTQAYDVEFQGTQANTDITTLIHWTSATGGAKFDGGDKFCWIQRPGGACVEITTVAYNYWDDLLTLAGTCKATIAGHSVGALNTAHDVWVVSPTSLLIRGASAGTGGTISKHFHMYTWWHMTESSDPVRIVYRVPIVKEYKGEILRTDFELNTSKNSLSVAGWWLEIAPTVDNPTTITTTENGVPVAHGLSTGDFVYIRGINYTTDPEKAVAEGAHQITVTSPTTFTIPFAITQPPVMYPSGTFANRYGRVWKPLIGYFRNVWALRNYTANESDTTFFARP